MRRKAKKVINANLDVAAIDAAASEALNRFMTENKPSPINFELTLMSIVLKKDDLIEAWKKVVKSYDAKGLQEAIAEVKVTLHGM